MIAINWPRVHWADAAGNLEWVERVLANEKDSSRFSRGKFHLTDGDLRKLLRLAYRNGAGEQNSCIRAVMESIGQLVPSEKP